MPYSGGPVPAQQNDIYYPDGALDLWFAARQKAAQQIVPIAGIGDSILRGANSTTQGGQYAWAQLVNALKAKYGDAGQGFLPVSDSTDPTWNSGGIAYDTTPCWTYSGSWNTANFPYGAGGVGYSSASGAGNTATGVFTGTGLDLICGVASSGGPFSVTIDGQPYDKNGVQGGAGGNPTCNNAARSSPNTVFAVRGLVYGQHTIVLTSVSGQMFLHGMLVYGKQSWGILPYKMGFSSKSLCDVMGNLIVDSAKASVELWAAQPKLVVIEYVVNDMQQGRAYSTYARHLARLCDSARNSGAAVVHLVPAISQIVGNWTNANLAQHYIERVHTIARRYGNVVVDINAAWERLGPTAAQALTSGGGNSHPTQAGHNDIAARLIPLLV